MTLSIGIVGAGAIGSTIAARLGYAEHNVTLFARGARLAALRLDGLRLHGEKGTIRASPALSDHAHPETLDILLYAVKSQDLPEAVPAFLPALRPGGMVVPLVNGLPWWYPLGRSGTTAEPLRSVDPDGRLLNRLDPAAIAGAVVFLRASIEADGAVRSAARERLVLGRIGEEAPSHLAPLAMLLNGAGVATRVSEAIRADVWSKIALNLATNPLSVVSGATLHAMFHDATLLKLVVAILEETCGVALADGISPATDLLGMIEIGRGAGAFMTSMAQDHEAGRPLELTAIADSVFELALRHGCAMPVASAVAELTRYRASAR